MVIHDSDDLRPTLGPTPRHNAIYPGTAAEAVRVLVRGFRRGHELYLGDHPPDDYNRPIYISLVGSKMEVYEVSYTSGPGVATSWWPWVRWFPKEDRWQCLVRRGLAVCPASCLQALQDGARGWIDIPIPAEIESIVSGDERQKEQKREDKAS